MVQAPGWRVGDQPEALPWQAHWRLWRLGSECGCGKTSLREVWLAGPQGREHGWDGIHRSSADLKH